jgi:hypothetical protein
MALHLYFPLPETLRLAEHAVAATEHSPSFTEVEDGITCTGALIWVHDQGIYLMSGGLPRLLDPANPESSLIVYAEGWNPDRDGFRRDYTDLGGDDFAEHLHLTEGTPPLINLLRTAHTAGYLWLCLTVTRETFDISVRAKRPATP